MLRVHDDSVDIKRRWPDRLQLGLHNTDGDRPRIEGSSERARRLFRLQRKSRHCCMGNTWDYMGLHGMRTQGVSSGNIPEPG
jgi:hypothetical protein